MTLSPVVVEGFGGLNLVTDPGEVGWNGAIDLINVDLDKRGCLRTRDGVDAFTTSAGTNGYDSLIGYEPTYGSSTDAQVVAGAGFRLEAIGSSGVVDASLAAGITASPHYFTRFGSATASYIYIANGTDQIRRWDGTNFTSPGGLGAQTGRFLAVQTPDNRMVHARTATNTSRVAFSDAGDAETFGANNYVDIRPGDGEDIRALVTWRNQVFAFKQTCFGVFYGNSTDSSGNPIFNFRVEEGMGVNPIGAAVAHIDGVYFVGRDGIYRTTGGPAIKISRAIDPFFEYAADQQFYQGAQMPEGVLAGTVCVPISYYDRLLFPLGTDTLIYNPATEAWLEWRFPTSISYFGSFPSTSTTQPRSLLYPSSSPKHIYKFRYGSQDDPAPTDDDGTAITSRYRSGFSDLGSPDMKRIHSWRLQGSGSPTLKLSTDFGSLETGEAVTLGTSPAIAEGTRRYAPRGRQFSWQLSGTSPWSVNSIVANVAGKRRTGEHVS